MSQRTVERYNPSTNRWTSLPGLTTRRENLGVAVYDGQVFAAGGFDRSFLSPAVLAHTGSSVLSLRLLVNLNL
jgi:Flp pilus assembly secretin CpaC